MHADILSMIARLRAPLVWERSGAAAKKSEQRQERFA
jgi:hypothetical protein